MRDGLCRWSIGLAYNHGVKWPRPAWLVHPATRSVLIWFALVFLFAWPAGLFEDQLGTLVALMLPGLLALPFALLWFFLFGRPK